MKFNAIIRNILLLLMAFCVLSISTITGGCKKSSPNKTPVKTPAPAAKPTTEKSTVQTPPAPKPSVEPPPAQNPVVSKSLVEIISRRDGWNPILANFYGKKMPDFTVQDINGKQIKLSDYRGKNVMVVFWATWCVPCMQEVPHLKALREIIDSNSLAILAISNEPQKLVKSVAESKNMNYTVISCQDQLPEPFGGIRGFPTSFFIRPNGILKLVVEGQSNLGEMKSIILAE
jgi:peroxiredoxin